MRFLKLRTNQESLGTVFQYEGSDSKAVKWAIVNVFTQAPPMTKEEENKCMISNSLPQPGAHQLFWATIPIMLSILAMADENCSPATSEGHQVEEGFPGVFCAQQLLLYMNIFN